jgi:predicted nucleic acid-binding protein
VIVIDSSAFVKYLLKEDGYQNIKHWLHPDKDPHSVSMLLAKVGNVLWKYHRMNQISDEKAAELY